MPFSDTRFPEGGQRFRRAERRFQRILVAGFGVVLLLMLGCGLLGLYAMQRLGQSTEILADRYLIESRLADKLQRAQGSVGVLLDSLLRQRSESGFTRHRAEADTLKKTILGLVDEASAGRLPATEQEAWERVRQAAEPLFREIARLIDTRGINSEELSVQHRAFVAATARLMDTAYDDVETDRTRARNREAGIIRNSQALLISATGVAIFCAALCVIGAVAVFHGLEKQAEALAKLSVHALAEQEAAARRFSQEMHDEFGQTLNAIESTLSAVDSTSEVQRARIADAIALSKDAQSMAREMSQLLRPRILDDFGLDAGLRELALGFSRRTGIAVDYRSAFRDRLDAEVETHLFRIAQEALTNTARHTTATTVELSLRAEQQLLQLRVVDNGGGFATEASASSLGLFGMKERARACGGRLHVQSKPGAGVEILAEVPFHAAAAGVTT